jgi:ribosomal protein L33
MLIANSIPAENKSNSGSEGKWQKLLMFSPKMTLKKYGKNCHLSMAAVSCTEENFYTKKDSKARTRVLHLDLEH